MSRLVVITGISGSGKSLAARCFEDLGFFCVDNLPVELIGDFASWVASNPGRKDRSAAVVDVRDEANLDALPGVLDRLARDDVQVRLIFFECTDNALNRRFSETRRPHPMSREGEPLLDAIRREREIMSPVRERADRIIDTTQFNAHELRSFLKNAYGGPESGLNVNVISFGFKYGVPTEADLVFDLRFLPNPYFVDGLRAKTGRDAEVRDYLAGFPLTGEFKTRLRDFVDFLLPHFARGGKTYVSIALGCTGGKHRSVAMAEALSKHLQATGRAASVTHRDLGME